uniref:Uncharacterized protein n=1 Tax=Hyaloperonospora arabidopsidis (strain Emoy2) TaxID=559515 RepID=M4C4Q2_HYAAE
MARKVGKAKTSKEKTKAAEDTDEVIKDGARMRTESEGQPFMVRGLTVAVTSYLAHTVWTKRKMLTDTWYTEEQTETERLLVTLFEYMCAMGLIFFIGLIVGVVCRKGAKLAKGLTNTE